MTRRNPKIRYLFVFWSHPWTNYNIYGQWLICSSYFCVVCIRIVFGSEIYLKVKVISGILRNTYWPFWRPFPHYLWSENIFFKTEFLLPKVIHTKINSHLNENSKKCCFTTPYYMRHTPRSYIGVKKSLKWEGSGLLNCPQCSTSLFCLKITKYGWDSLHFWIM